MGYTEDQTDLDRLAYYVRRLADGLANEVTIHNNRLNHFAWKTPYDTRLRELIGSLADMPRALYALADEIEEHETRGQADT